MSNEHVDREESSDDVVCSPKEPVELRRWSLDEIAGSSRIIGMDFDGTITTGGYPTIGEPNLEIISAIKKMRSLGWRVVIWTCRTAKTLTKSPEFSVRAIEEWLAKHEIEVDGILMAEKPVWDTYIGDEAFNITNIPLIGRDT